MKHFKFYRDTTTPGNVIATYEPTRTKSRLLNGTVEALVAIFNKPDSDTSFGVGDPSLVTDEQKISEEEAREIHPALFARLDGWHTSDDAPL